MLVLDLRSHDQAWVHERLGDRVRGFKDEELARLLEEAGLTNVQVRVGARLEGDPFTVLVAAGTNSAPRARGQRRRERTRAATRAAPTRL